VIGEVLLCVKESQKYKLT